MIVVLGVPGVGKSTVLRRVADLAQGWHIINWGDVMLNQAKKMGVEDRDKIRKMPISKQKELQHNAAMFLVEKDNQLNGKLLVDTHCSIFTPNGYLPGLPMDILLGLKPKCLILLSAKPEEILVRRMKDKSREREVDIEQIREQLRLNECFLATFATIASCPGKIVYNPDGGVDKAAEEIVSVLRCFEGHTASEEG